MQTTAQLESTQPAPMQELSVEQVVEVGSGEQPTLVSGGAVSRRSVQVSGPGNPPEWEPD
jgi:hypothetical protein